MAEDPRPPVAIRITRPYASEDEFLEHELDVLTRTSVTLLGAQPRPQGVVLRFELVLSSGQAILRGEGRVVGFKPDALHGLGGLTLRFTRLDTRSKALVDKAAAARERRRPSHAPPPVPSAPSAIASDPSPSQPPAAPSEPEVSSSPSLPPPSVKPPPVSVKPPPVSARPPPLPQSARPPPVSVKPPPVAAKPAGAPARAVEAPATRDELLERLRSRAKRLDDADVQRILAQGKRAHAHA